jgi:osmotically inducible protein OsmC
MPVYTRNATVNWAGTVKEGAGEAKAGTGAFVLPVSFMRRVGEPEGITSPEELIAAAHASCYAMALNAHIGRKGGAIEKTHVTATVEAEFENGITIKASRLEVVAEGLSGVEAGDFHDLAHEASDNCPVSNALKGSLIVEIKSATVK